MRECPGEPVGFDGRVRRPSADEAPAAGAGGQPPHLEVHVPRGYEEHGGPEDGTEPRRPEPAGCRIETDPDSDPGRRRREEHQQPRVGPQDALPPGRPGPLERGHGLVADGEGELLQHADYPVRPFHLHLPHPVPDLREIRVALGPEPGAQALVLDRHGGCLVVDLVEAPGREAARGEGALPGPEDLLRVVFPGRVVDLVQDVQELARVGPPDGPLHEVAQGVLHRPRLGVPGVEEHQHQIREPDDVIGDAQDRGPLLVGVEPRGVDDDLAADARARARLELEVRVDAPPLAGRHLLDVAAHLVEREPRIGVEGEAGEGARRPLAGAEANRGEAVVHRLVAGELDRLAEIAVDERGLAGREGAEHRDEGPPGDLDREGLVGGKEAQLPCDLVEASEGAHRVEQDRVLLAQVPFEAVELPGQGIVHWESFIGNRSLGVVHWESFIWTGSSCTTPARQWPERPPDFSTSRTPAMVIPRSAALHMS